MDIKKGFFDFLHDFEHSEQKRSFFLVIFIVFIGVFSVFVGFFNTNKNINTPFINPEKEALNNMYDTYDKLKSEGKLVEETPSVTQNTNTDASSNAVYSGYPSKTIDTDGDGLFDYEEVNVFHTSAFLKDSDGDGISDYDEAKSGTNPNCPTGKVCSSLSGVSNTDANNIAAPTTSTDQTGKATSPSTVDFNSMDITKAREELNKIIPENLKASLAAMTDDQVRELIKQLYQNNTTTSSSTSPVVKSGDYVSLLKTKLPAFTPEQISKIKDMDEASIKKLLLDSGIADDALLSNFKAGELKSTVIGQ